MSVPSGDRNTSELEYIHTAREIACYTIDKTKKWPVRLRTLKCDMQRDADFIYDRVCRAKDLWPTNEKEAAKRKKYLKAARGKLKSLTAKLEIACESYPEARKQLPAWAALLDLEISLINGVIDADRRRFRFDKTE